MKYILAAIMFSFVAPAALADDHEGAVQVPVEVWACNYKDGKSLADLEAWYEGFNSLSDQMENPEFSAWIWSPYFVSDLKGADVAIATSFPSLESMGQSMQEFFGGEETGQLFIDYQDIVDCTSRELWMVQQMRSGM